MAQDTNAICEKVAHFVTRCDDARSSIMRDNPLKIGELDGPSRIAVARRLHWQHHVTEEDLMDLFGTADVAEWIEWEESDYTCACGARVGVWHRTADTRRWSRLGGVICRRCAMARILAESKAREVEAKAAAHDKAEKVAALKMMPYDDYLKTDHWQSIREKALEHDGHRCRLCNSPDNLNVHHRTYKNRGCETIDDVTTLCQPCHQMFHDRMNIYTGEPF